MIDKLRLLWKIIKRGPHPLRHLKKIYKHHVTAVGKIIEPRQSQWVYWGCEESFTWLVTNEIFNFIIIKTELNREDYKIYYTFAFKNAEDAMAFKLGYVK